MNHYPSAEGFAPELEVKENTFAGAVGAFLFALVGGVLWVVLYQLGFLAGISGIVGVICAIKGYQLFAKKSSTKGIVIAVIMTVLVLVIAWYLCLSLDAYQAHIAWFEAGELDYRITFADAVLGSYIYLFDPETALSCWGDLLIGLLLCGTGCFAQVRQAVAKNKAAEPAKVEEEVVWTEDAIAQATETDPADNSQS